MPTPLEHAHDPASVANRLSAPHSNSYLRDAIYGAIDGAVTTFAVATGVWGADLSPAIVVILGIANLVGDGFSMAAGNFLGIRAENQERDLVREIERRHISKYPEGEREEIRQIMRGQGFEGELLENAVEQITSDEDRWVNTMLRYEYGLAVKNSNPLPAATVTFVSFLVVGSIPLLPFVVTWLADIKADPFMLSAGMTAVAFFVVGGIKSRFVEQSWWKSGLETLAVGSVAASLAFVCGWALSGIAPEAIPST